MEKIDSSHQNLKVIISDVESYGDSIFSEQDTRIKIIDRILLEVLDYNYGDFITEPSSGEGFIDYKVSINGISKLIIEAKKEALTFGIDEPYSGRAFKLNGPVFKNKTVVSGLQQAIYYSAMEGTDLTCLTNGKTWIIFRTNRSSENKKPFEGKAFVFSSLEAVEKGFKLFYELLSYDHVSNITYKAIFQEVDGLTIRTKEDANSLINEDRLRLIERGEFAYDIDRVMSEFFSRLSGDSDVNMLAECFVETKESKLAESQLKRLSEDLIQRIRTLETREGSILQDLIERVQNTNRHEFVILVGGKGAGKSTFIDRFFKITLSEEIKHHCILVRINVGESDGNTDTILEWLNRILLEECETLLFDGSPSYDELVSIFFHEYRRLSEGPWSGLYEKDKEQFKIEFGQHIEKRREERPHEHIKRLIGDITKSRKKVPCIVFDNTDHFGIDFQEKVFQYARSIYEKEICLVIIPITDKTSWQLSKQGAIQSFENETLFLPTPSPLKIIERRINYLQKLIESDRKTKSQYFFNRGIKLQIVNLENFTKNLQSIFLKDFKIMNWIGNFSNLDIRRCLDFTRDIMTSPHISSNDLLVINFTQNEEFPVDIDKVKNAIIKRGYTSYPVGHHSYLQNVFYLDNNLNTSPIISLRILKLLIDKSRQLGKDDNYILVNEILDYMNNMGFENLVTLNCLDFLLKKGLIYSYDPTILNIDNSKKLEISPSGFEHFWWGFNDEDYIFSMIAATPIPDKELYLYLKENYYYKSRRIDVLTKFLDLIEKEDKQFCFIPDHTSYKGQHDLLNHYLWRKRKLLKIQKERISQKQWQRRKNRR